MLTLRSVYKDGIGAEALYDLLRDRSEENDPNVNISHRRMPSMGEHLRFFRSRPYRAWYFIKENGLIAGYVALSHVNEISIVLSTDYRGRGIGAWAVREATTRHRPLPAIPARRVGAWLANINPKNERSIRMFESLGFSLKAQTYERA